MTRTILCSVSDDRAGRKGGRYAATQQHMHDLFKASPQFGITDHWDLTWDDIAKTGFYAENRTLLDDIDASRNGRAYKPFAILDAMTLCAQDGDYLIYSDCSPEMWDNVHAIPPEASLQNIRDNCDKAGGILVAFVKWSTDTLRPGELGIHTHRILTTNICMDTMNMRQYEDAYMPASGMIVIRKSPETVRFVAEWLKWNVDARCCGLGDPTIPGDTSYWEPEVHLKTGHRHDQSIVGLLLASMDWKAADIRYNEMNPYSFLQYCLPGELELIPLLPAIGAGDYVTNKQGVLMKVWRVDGERYVVGKYEQSCYAAERRELKLVVTYMPEGVIPEGTSMPVINNDTDIPKLLAYTFDPKTWFVTGDTTYFQLEQLLLNNAECQIVTGIKYVETFLSYLAGWNYHFFTDGQTLECIPVFVPYKHPRTL